MPKVFGPQWEEMVQPAVVSMISEKGAMFGFLLFTASTVSGRRGYG